MKPTIKKVTNSNEIPWNLLLLADPSKEVVEKYVKGGETYIALLNDKTIGVYVVVKLSHDTFELKNVAVDEEHQGQGIGKMLVLDAIERVRQREANRIEVGTGNSSLSQLALYQKCGFRIIGIEKDFFVNNYPEEIFENGIKCVDMVRLALDLK